MHTFFIFLFTLLTWPISLGIATLQFLVFGSYCVYHLIRHRKRPE